MGSNQWRLNGSIEHRIRQQPFQTSVFVLETLQPLGLADIHAAILGFPLVDGRIADAVLAAQIGDRNPGLVLFQNAPSRQICFTNCLPGNG